MKEYDSVDVIAKFFGAFAEADYETMRKNTLLSERQIAL